VLYKKITNYQFTYNVNSLEEEQPYYITLPCPDDLKEPEWDLKNNTQIEVEIIVDENGEFNDTPIFEWRSVGIKQTNDSEPVFL
jgi:hypothetical protein